MSQNKTVIPGLEPANPYQGNPSPIGMPYGAQMPLQQQNAYQRQQSSQRATRIPGMNQQPDEQAAAAQLGVNNALQQRKTFFASDKPVLGFLYSISRTPAGEFWPLYQGPNSIGQSEQCSIQLLEGTVSFNHAVLNVRMMKNPEKMIAFITDTMSTNGTMVNGESLGSTPKDCKNGDKIVIGDNYEMYLVLLDPATLGLKVSETFMPVEFQEDPYNPNAPLPYGPDEPTRDYSSYDPYSRSGGGYVPTNGTVGLDGTPGSNKGGTIAY